MPVSAPDHVILRGATLVDGTGGPARPADVEIVGDTIGRVGTVGGVDSDVPEVDLSGLVLAPGFVDLHTHYDAQVFWDPALGASTQHGVTTVVTGNCGFTIAPARPGHRERLIRILQAVEGMSPDALRAGIPWGFESFPDYLSALRRLPLGVNVAALVGHSAVRLDVMGERAMEAEACDEERRAMASLVAEAVGAGAIGFSTSRSPSHRDADGHRVPSMVGDPSEVAELARAAAAAGGTMLEAIVGPDLSVEDLARLAEETELHVSPTPLMTGVVPVERQREILELVDSVDSVGGCLRPQVICVPHVAQATLATPGDFAFLGEAFRPLVGLERDELLARYASPEWRHEARRTLTDMGSRALARASLAETVAHPELAGRSLAAIAEDRGTDPLTALLDVTVEDRMRNRVRFVYANEDEDELIGLLRDRRTIFGLSDAGAHVDRTFDARFPTHLLGHWVRDRGMLDLEFAVWRLSGQPAAFLKLADRGMVRPGYRADLVAFDPVRVGDLPLVRTFDLPAGADRLVAPSEGIEHVWVNGRSVRRHGRPEEVAAGVVLGPAGRRGPAS
jgi:N-acyl-D-aspartate/D-glutamate deacylase